MLTPHTSNPAADIATALALLTAAIGCATDLRSRRIPNLLTMPAMVLGLALGCMRGGWHGLGSALAALCLCGLVFFAFHLAGGMGAGDVKLIAAEGALLGLANAAPLLVYTALAGGVLALVMAYKHGRLRQTAGNVGTLLLHHGRSGFTPHPELNVRNASTLRLPYALAIAAGVALTVLLQSARG